MPITKEQQIVSDFYENIGNVIKGHLIDIVDGPLVRNFIMKLPDMFSRTMAAKSAETNDYMLTYSDKRANIQVPTHTRQMVWFDKLVKTKEFKNSKASLPIILGVDTFGKPIVMDLYTMPHLLITGRTGTGKTVLIQVLLKSLMAKFSPSECKFVIFDPKGCDFVDAWDKNKYMLLPVEKFNIKFDSFDKIQQIVEDRYQILADNKVKNLFEYRKKTRKKDMPHIIVAVDEILDYMITNKKRMEEFVNAICSKGRAVGVHLIFATQRPDKRGLTDIIKANFPSRVCFQARSVQEAKIMFDEPGPERLLGYGDMLYSDAGRVPIRIHTPYIA